MGVKGFFTIIFYNVEDKHWVFEGGPYFYNSTGLYLTFWKDRFNLDKVHLSVAPVWLRLYSLPCEFWRLEILEDIGNALARFVKIADQTKKMRYVSYARIYVYLDISKELLKNIKLRWRDEECPQTIDYEHISFHFRKCHEHGHLFREFPLNSIVLTTPSKHGEKDAEGFEKVNNRKKTAKRNPS